jgi:tetratricopeptide (TPR) repeat protein
MRSTLSRAVCLALLLGGVASGFARAQKPTPADSKELVAVMELDGVSVSKSQLAALTEELRAQLLQSGKFRVVDRQQIDTVLKEQALQQTGCTSQECAVQVGKILGVRKMVVGRVTKIEDDLWQVSAQMVNAETAETVRAVTYKHEGKFSTLMDQGMAVLAARLTGTAGVLVVVASAKPAAAAPARSPEPAPGPPAASNERLTEQQWKTKGIEAAGRKDFQQAVEDYTQALRLNPNNASLYRYRGIAYGPLGQHGRAIEDFDQSLRLDPKPGVYGVRGSAKFQLGRKEEAFADFRKACQLGSKASCSMEATLSK